jgi:D-alanyl-D-alanine carboxypeptidase
MTLTIDNLKYFFVTFLISLPFWWGVNALEANLEEFFFLQQIAENPQIFTAQLNLFPVKKQKIFKLPETGSLEIEAESAISVWLTPDGKEKILFEKESGKILPIASLTKLMTSYIVLEYYPDLSQVVEISKEAVFQQEDFGNLKVGERLSLENLLYIMLMESSNDAAFALSEVIGKESFVNLMNWEAENLGMKNTHFVDSMGISPKNVSSPKDLVKFAKKLLEKPLIWEILQKKEFELYGPDGVFHHKLLNTNQLLGKMENILGGKTGYTLEAKGCFLLVLKAPDEKGFLINVILGSENRFTEMEKLINAITKS